MSYSYKYFFTHNKTSFLKFGYKKCAPYGTLCKILTFII
nr:MAG TPA: hypothetical protein [Caudoviricetes sp.]